MDSDTCHGNKAQRDFVHKTRTKVPCIEPGSNTTCHGVGSVVRNLSQVSSCGTKDSPWPLLDPI